MNVSGKEIAVILNKGNGNFSQIERKRNNKDEVTEVAHSAWNNVDYHEDIKYAKSSNPREITEAYKKKRLQEKQQLKVFAKNLIKKYKNNDE